MGVRVGQGGATNLTAPDPWMSRMSFSFSRAPGDKKMLHLGSSGPAPIGNQTSSISNSVLIKCYGMIRIFAIDYIVRLPECVRQYNRPGHHSELKNRD